MADVEQEPKEKEQDFSGNYIQNFGLGKEGEFFPRSFQKLETQGNRLLFHAETTIMEVIVVSDKVIRFRYRNYEIFSDDFSYAISSMSALKKPNYKVEEQENQFSVKTKLIECLIDKRDFRVIIKDLEGNILQEDEKGFHWIEEKNAGGNIVMTTKVMQDHESFYGLGDKPSQLNLRGKSFQLWGTDRYGFLEHDDPIYKNIPFFIGLRNDQAYGVFFDNTFRSYFDFGRQRKDVYSWWAQGGEMRYYFIYGPTTEEVTKQYTQLTGKADMPPKWALGYHQSKWSYYPENVVRDLCKTFRDKKIPCDVIHLDIDYMDGYRIFTWDKERFPDPKKMISDLNEDGFKFVTIVDPGIKVDTEYDIYKEGVEGDHFCKNGDGGIYRGSVWPGICHFPDFTKKATREWWSKKFNSIMDMGVSGIWNDMNEPAAFEIGTFPMHVRFDYDGHPCSHRRAHNVYASNMAEATKMGLENTLNGKRVFNITRSAYAGIQRHACVWTGDNVASWDHLKIANRQCQRLAASGVSFVGSDVGGFINSPDGELFLRWIQMATFHPFFRTHSSGDHGDKEPWVFGEEITNEVRKYIEFRYELLPYIYTVFHQYHKHAEPMLKGLYMLDQNDKETHHRSEEFGLGRHLLICPISKPNDRGRWMYLPKGEWFNFWTNEIYLDSGEVYVEAELDQIPLFVKSGSVIPMQEKMQYVGEKIQENIDLLMYAGTQSLESEFYEDEDDGQAYKTGHFKLRTFKYIYENDEKEIVLTQSSEGTYKSPLKTFDLKIYGLIRNVNSITIDGEIKRLVRGKKGIFTIHVPADFKEINI